MGNREGNLEKFYDFSLEYFKENKLPSLTKADTVFLIQRSSTKNEGSQMQSLIRPIQQHTDKVIWLSIRRKGNLSNDDDSCNYEDVAVSDIFIPEIGVSTILNQGNGINSSLVSSGADRDIVQEGYLYFECYLEFALKLVLNFISTCAHVRKGLVVENIMVNLRLCNSKLFDRAVRFVMKLGKDMNSIESNKRAREFVVRAISGRDWNKYEKSWQEKSVDTWIKMADGCPAGIVPIAILLSYGESYEEAVRLLKEEPVLRKHRLQ